MDYRVGNARDNSTVPNHVYRFGLSYSYTTGTRWELWFRSHAGRDAFVGVIVPFALGIKYLEFAD